MKTLLLMRHAKSSWKDSRLDDYDRPLNKRGRRDAPRMARWLVQQKCLPDWLITSGALRARCTAEAIESLPDFTGHLRVCDGLYHATPPECLAALAEIPDSAAIAMLVGHNPGLEELLEALTAHDERMPTACIARLQCPITHWHALELAATCRLVDLWRPREIAD